MPDSAPLAGLRVVVTRARAQAAELVSRLTELGADVIELPVIEVEEPADGGAGLRAAASALAAGAYAWVVVTSVNGARRLLAVLGDGRGVGGTQVAAIGPATAAVLADGGVAVDLVPDRFVAEALVDAFPLPPSGGGRVLLARAAAARDVLPDGLRAKGWSVEVVEAYRTRTATVTPEQLEAAAAADVVTFTAPSTVDGYVAVVGAERAPAVVACIGPVTAAAARRHGIPVTVEAGVHTVDGLVDALVDGLRAGLP
ncbi:MAG: uroporphyrinogen-III synthase [Acidimicrobiales bacterium]